MALTLISVNISDTVNPDLELQQLLQHGYPQGQGRLCILLILICMRYI
jgi:hypothetical protein